MSLKEIIHDRINRMEDLDQRRELKNIMTGLFMNLANYQEEMMSKLEGRIFSEIDNHEELQTIYSTVCAREELDPIHDYLYPMVEEDVNEPLFHSKEAIEAFAEKKQVFLYTLFLACDYPKLQRLITEKPLFKGKMITNKGVHTIEVVLHQSQKYLREIEKLYRSFLKNGLSWKTVNHPYAAKFFDVFLEGMEGEFQEDEKILEISVHLEEWEPYKRTNIIPLWNVQPLEIATTGFPFPALDRVNFEHSLSLKKYGNEHGYLIGGEEINIRFMKRLTDSLVVVSPVEESKKWKLLKITQPTAPIDGDFPFELVSNKRKDSFITRYAANQPSRTIQTKGEMIRIIESFEASAWIRVADISILDERVSELNTYDMNPFVNDNIRIDQNKKVLRISFESEKEHPIFIYDRISFLVTEIQRYFPEYRCEGVLV